MDVSIPGLPAAVASVQGIDDLVMDETAHTMRRSVDVIEAAVVQRTPVASGATRQGWGTEVHRGAATVRGQVSNPVTHAYYAEHGRAPGRMPPISAIQMWVGRASGSSPSEMRSAAFLIARAIGRRGTKGAFMARDGLAAVKGRVQMDFNGIAGRVVARFK